MADRGPTIETALARFDQGRYREAFAAFADIYDRCQDAAERRRIFDVLEEAYYAPNAAELQANYEKNLQALKRYPYFWEKAFHNFEALSFQLFPVSDEVFFCYDRKRDRFLGEYDAMTRHQMRYFFENLNDPVRVEDEDNFYNLNFLNDNVRDSMDYAGDNHIYLMYTSLEPLERLMLTCDLEPLLEQKKFIFLVGEKNWKRYPINFSKKYHIDYKKGGPRPLRIEEINRIYLNLYYGYSGTIFFEQVMSCSDHVLAFDGFYFHVDSSREVLEVYYEHLSHPDRMVDVSWFFSFIAEHQKEIKLLHDGWSAIAACLPHILSGRKTAAVHELWKAIMIAAIYVSQQVEKKQYFSRITPVIFLNPHMGPSQLYFELMKHFKYPAIEATMREPIVRFMRHMACYGLGNAKSIQSHLRSTYAHSQGFPKWLTDRGFYAAKLEDLKLKPQKTLRTVCRIMNIPYSEKLTSGKQGIWCNSFTNEKGETLQGFDPKSAQRDVSDMVTMEDLKRFELYYWEIHHYFKYPCAAQREQLSRSEAEKVFAAPFQFEQIYAAQQSAYKMALKTAPPKEAELIRACIDQKCPITPGELRLLVQQIMTEDYLNGFDPQLALPTVMFPEDEMEWPLPQSRRLQLGAAGSDVCQDPQREDLAYAKEDQYPDGQEDAATGKAVELFDQGKYQESFSIFAGQYNNSQDAAERRRMFGMLEKAYYLPNAAAFRDNYEKNLRILNRYPYFWGKAFRDYGELSIQLFPVGGEVYYCYDRGHDRFLGEYDGGIRHQIPYFFETLDGPVQIKDEDNFYNLNFLNDNVRDSMDYAGDNHIYLMYTSLEPLERLMLTCDLEPLLVQEKFVFLVGERNWSRYPIKFEREFGIDYSSMKPAPIRLEELKRVCLFYAHAYSGSLLTQAVLKMSSSVQQYSGWEFNSQSMKGQQQLFYTMGFWKVMEDIHRKYTPDQIEEMAQSEEYELKLKGLEEFLDWLRQRRPSPHVYTVKELFCGYFLFLYEARGINARITPVLLFDPHMGDPNIYNNLILSFPYHSVLTSVREPVVTFARFLSYSGLCKRWNEDRIALWLGFDYCHGQILNPKLRAQYYGIRFEDMKTQPEKVCRALCRNLNIPYEPQMLEADGSFTDAEGNRIQGFDDKPLHRDVSGLLSEFDQLRLKMFYDPILKYYGYPRFPFEAQPLSDVMVRELFRYPFQLEYVIEKQSNGTISCADTHRWLQKMLQRLWKKEIICPQLLPLEGSSDG